MPGLGRQNDDVPFEAILAEVAVESEYMVEFVVVDQSKAGAIDEAEIFVVVLHENRPRRLFDRVTDTKDFDTGPIKTRHEPDGRLVTDSEANQGKCLGKDKIGCQKLSL